MKQLGRINRKEYIWETSIGNLLDSDLQSLNMSPSFQRAYVWDSEKASALIHSLLVDFPINTMVLGKSDGDYYVIDGKQRLTAIKEYAENKFALHPKTPDVFDVKVANLTVKELSLELQKIFYMKKLSFIVYESLDPMEACEMFLRLNSGTPMAGFARNSYRSVVQEQVVKLAHHPFFQEHYPLTPALQKTFVDEQLVAVTSMLFTEAFQSEGVGVNDIENYLDWLYRENHSLMTEKVAAAADYLADTAKHLTVRTKRKIFKKVDTIPMLLLAFELYEQGVPCKRYSEFLKEFFVDKMDSHRDYNVLREEGFNHRKNVMQRLELLREAFRGFIEEK